jgi:hypothetical protein
VQAWTHRRCGGYAPAIRSIQAATVAASERPRTENASAGSWPACRAASACPASNSAWLSWNSAAALSIFSASSCPIDSDRDSSSIASAACPDRRPAQTGGLPRPAGGFAGLEQSGLQPTGNLAALRDLDGAPCLYERRRDVVGQQEEPRERDVRHRLPDWIADLSEDGGRQQSDEPTR